MTASPDQEWGRRLSAPCIDQETLDTFIAAAAAGHNTPVETRRARVAANILPPEGLLFAVRVTPQDFFIRRQRPCDPKTRRVGVITESLPNIVQSGTILGARVRFNWELTPPDMAAMAAVDLADAEGTPAPDRLQLLVDPATIVERIGFIGMGRPLPDFLPPEQIIPTPER